jgi:hypothetical protein
MAQHQPNDFGRSNETQLLLLAITVGQCIQREPVSHMATLLFLLFMLTVTSHLTVLHLPLRLEKCDVFCV